MLRRVARIAALALGLAAVLPLAVEIGARTRDPVDLSRAQTTSPLLLGEQGAWIDARLSADEKWRFAGRSDDVPQVYLDLLLAYEDHRFHHHGGVSYRAILRAAASSLRAGRMVSGASTLPMQVARLLEGQRPGLRGKLQQAIAARRLVLDLPRDEILGLYLTLAPFGGNIEGIEAAARVYFGVPARTLDPATAALLVAVPQAPEARRLDLAPDAARDARDRVLARAVAAGALSQARAEDIGRTPVPDILARAPFGADHAVFATVAHDLTPDDHGIVASTLDARLQTQVRRALADALRDLPPSVNAAALVLRNADGAVKARVSGARGLAQAAGYVDLTRRLRSPGSALKPFIYGLAYERNLAHPQTVFHDRALRFGAFSPRNFDAPDLGPTTLNAALASSLNTAAVAVLETVGPEQFLARLAASGAHISVPIEHGQTAPGLAVALGGLGITLEDLAHLFAGLANGGQMQWDRASALGTRNSPQGVRVLSAGAAWAVSDALASAQPPDGALPFRSRNGSLRVAFKTGTSSGARDVWAVGYDRMHTVAVWIGRPDAGGMAEVSGRGTAAPALWRIFDALPVPARGVVPAVPKEAAHLAWRVPPRRLHTLGGNHDQVPLHIQFPQDGGVVMREEATQEITVKLSGGAPPYTFIINNALFSGNTAQSVTVAIPDGPLTITVVDATGARDSLTAWAE